MAIYTQNKKEVNDLFANFGGSKKRVMKVFGSYNGSKVLLYQYGSTPPTPPTGYVYGVEWDGSSSTVWTRTDDAVGFVDPSPAINNGTGSSPFDNIMPWSGIQIVEDAEAGTLVAIPKFYYKWTRNGSSMKLQISMTQSDGFLCSPAHADRGDGVGERDVVYVGRYHCATSNYKSISGVKPKASITRSAFRTNIHNLGTTIWQYDFAMFWTIGMLYLVEYADWDSQKVIGYGGGNRSATNMGTTDSMQYHTGTSASSKTTWGHMQYRYIEDLWSNAYDFIDGIYFSGTTIYCIKDPSLFSDTTNGTNIGTRAATNGCTKAWTIPSENGFEYALYPSETVSDTAYTTYISDAYRYSNSSTNALVGGSYGQGRGYGMFCIATTTASTSDGNNGSRLMKLPNS